MLYKFLGLNFYFKQNGPLPVQIFFIGISDSLVYLYSKDSSLFLEPEIQEL